MHCFNKHAFVTSKRIETNVIKYKLLLTQTVIRNLHFNAIRICSQSNTHLDCSVNRVSTRRITLRQLCGTHNGPMHAFGFSFVKKKNGNNSRKGEGGKARKPGYTGKEDYAILADGIVSLKTKRSTFSHASYNLARQSSQRITFDRF